jgi:hypothetical protein
MLVICRKVVEHDIFQDSSVHNACLAKGKALSSNPSTAKKILSDFKDFVFGNSFIHTFENKTVSS